MFGTKITILRMKCEGDWKFNDPPSKGNWRTCYQNNHIACEECGGWQLLAKAQECLPKGTRQLEEQSFTPRKHARASVGFLVAKVHNHFFGLGVLHALAGRIEADLDRLLTAQGAQAYCLECPQAPTARTANGSGLGRGLNGWLGKLATLILD